MSKYGRWWPVVGLCRVVDAFGLSTLACSIGVRSGMHDHFEALWYELDDVLAARSTTGNKPSVEVLA